MKTKHYFLIGTFGVAITAAIFAGCKKDSTPATTNTTTTSNTDGDYASGTDETNASYAMNDAENTSEGGVQSTSNERILGSSCARITWGDTVVNSMQDTLMEINFGSADCLCLDGVYRRGIIFVYWARGSKFYGSGTQVTMTFKNYYVREIGIAGTRTLTNLSVNNGNGTDTTAGSMGGRSFTFVANLTLTYPSGKTATWSATRTHTIVDTAGKWYYRITGSATGISSSGKGYSLVISSALYHTVALGIWRGGCPWMEQGVITITRTGNSDALSINYGTIGNCNDKATATIVVGGVSATFTIII